jgi:hypothetical protein
MAKRAILRHLAALLVIVPGSIGAREQGEHGPSWPSRAQEFRVSYTSELQPIVINRIHGWVLHVETAAGAPVEDASIEINGGMPEHDHGLPTAPEVTRNLGDGDYLVEGLRFHMNGYWELEFTIMAGGATDTVVIPLTL